MVEILEEPKSIVKRIFHCSCGCTFQADRSDYELLTSPLTQEIKFKIKCPWCNIEHIYTDKNSEYKYMEVGEK